MFGIPWWQVTTLTEVAQSCQTLQPHGLQPTSLLCPWDFPGKSTGVVCQFLLQGIFPTQGSNLGLPRCRQMLYHLSYQGSQCRRHRFNPWSRKSPHATENLSPSAATIQPVLQGPGTATTEAHAPQSPRSAAREATTVRSPRTRTRESPHTAVMSQHSQK